jgi:putative ABC transport system substrate-binding protein
LEVATSFARRKFVGGIAATLAWPFVGHAQQGERIRRIGVLTGRSEDDETTAWLGALQQRLSERGWRIGGNLRIEIRADSDVERRRAHANELVSLHPEVLLAVGNPEVVALHQATQSIPIVFALVGNPVGSGFVSSLAHPGGHITGFMHFEPAMGGKWLEMLKEIAPSVQRVMVIYLPEVQANVEFLREARAAGAVYGVAIIDGAVRDRQDVQRAILAFAAEKAGGLIALPNPVTGSNRDLIGALSLRLRLPTIGAFRYMPTSGTLASYGIDILNVFRSAGDYIDRILRGEKPADLPVQAPTKYELVINVKAAHALGIDVSPMLLARADEVIE